MKKLLFSLLFLFSIIESKAQYDHQNIDLLGLFDDPTVNAEPVYGIRYQSCWGWVNPVDQKEYGIIGSTAGTYIIDVTDPTNLIQADYIPHRQTDCIWHEYKTYGNYLYIISDDGGNNSLQIADLSTLPDSAHVIYDSNAIFTHSHTLYVDGNKLYVGSVSQTGNFSSMNVYSLNNPALPVLLRRLDSDYPAIGSVHDMFVINDTVFASCGYQGLYIFHYDSVANQFNPLGTLTNFPTQRYNHSSFISPDHDYLYMCDEVPDGMPFSVVDIRDISNPAVIGTYNTHTGATPHNPYVKDNLLYIAGYQDGLYIYDITNPVTPTLAGFFDTHPQNPAGTYPSPAYQGCWAAYTDLPSGNILASDMQLGLFVLDITSITNSVASIKSNKAFMAYPVPAVDKLNIRFTGNNFDGQIKLINAAGQIVYQNTCRQAADLSISTSELPSGIYSVVASTDKENFNQRITILNRD
jgi:choice-of-anchor B domain-containing protein